MRRVFLLFLRIIQSLNKPGTNSRLIIHAISCFVKGIVFVCTFFPFFIKETDFVPCRPFTVTLFRRVVLLEPFLEMLLISVL